MFISLHELELRPVKFAADVAPGSIDFEAPITQPSDLHAEGVAELLNRSLGEVRIHGRLTGSVEAPCDRCLEAAQFPIDRQFDLVYMPSDSVTRSGGEEEIEQTGIDVGYYEGAGLELNDVVREVVLLALPMQLVCAESCKGICPECGQNRNVAACNCRTEHFDERWSGLKNLRAEIGSSN